MHHLRLACTAVLALIALSSFAAPPTNEPRSAASEGNGPQFVCHLAQRLAPSPDSLVLVVSVSVPYDNLVFVRADTGFRTSFQLTTSLFKGTDGLLTERISDVDVRALSFGETNSRTNSAIHVDEFRVPAGDYHVRVTLTSDTEARRKSKWEGTIKLIVSDPMLRVSDIYWMSEDTTVRAAGMPRFADTFSSSDSLQVAHVQVYSMGKDPLHLHWALVGEKSDTVRQAVTTVMPTGGVQDEKYSITLKELTPQQYTLKLDVEGSGRHEDRSRAFSLRIPGVPSTIKNIEQAIRELKYVASGDEVKKMLAAPPAERQQMFRDFWRKQDPAGGSGADALMDEYYRRIAYANEHFSTNRPGWETDRGRIYVRYGEPTDIERHPFEAGSRPFEIWYYSNLALRFEFVDITGFGDYQLVSPEWGY